MIKLLVSGIFSLRYLQLEVYCAAPLQVLVRTTITDDQITCYRLPDLVRKVKTVTGGVIQSQQRSSFSLKPARCVGAGTTV